MTAMLIKTFIATVLGLALAGCGGGGGDATTPPPASTDIGAAGGTVAGPSGAQVVVPAGALAASTAIAVAQTSAGAPPLPVGVTAFGPIFEFTPHGRSFAVPVTITVPFDPALVPAGTKPVLYKTNAAMTGWAEVAGATVNGSSMSGAVTGFSYLVVAPKPPPALEKGSPTRHWEVYEYRRNKDLVLPAQDIGDQPSDKPPGEDPADLPAGVKIDKPYDFGPASFDDPALPLPPLLPREFRATGRIFASPGGGSYSVSGEAPIGLTPQSSAGSWLSLHQSQSYKKSAANATLQLLVTQARIEAIDQGPAARELCTLPKTDPNASLCGGAMNASISFEVRAYNHRLGTFFKKSGSMTLNGWRGNWFGDVEPVPGMQQKFLWLESDFKEDIDVDHDGGKHYRRSLKQSLPVPIDLSSVSLPNEEFTLEVVLQTEAFNGRPGGVDSGSYVGAFLRDPTQIGGDMQLITEGLEPTDRPEPAPPSDDPNLPPECRVGPSAGTLQFVTPAYTVAEAAGPSGVGLLVTRTGGSAGRVSATIATSDGTATAPGDYQSVRTAVTFEDGDIAPRFVNVPLVYSPDAEGDKTFNVTLSAPTGCASLGQATSVVTILDDTRPLPVPVPVPTFRLGGTITGLVGSGLTLRTNSFDQLQPAASGAFTFTVPVADGSAYSVRVETQPTNPIQICTVANGVGTIANANVTNVAVTCATPAPNGSLDPSFGNAGKVASNITFVTSAVDARMGMALQADGRILLVGGLKLARFNGDGTPDTSFGTAGVVTVPFNGSPYDMAQGVAVQTDGRIVVVGTMSVGGTTADKQDFALARFNTDGTPDISFGTGGRVTTDFNGNQDIARRIVIQPDGKLLVAGYSTLVAPTFTENQFALARYNADGSLDASFSSPLGRTTTGFGGTFNRVQGLTLQRDGNIVVAGVTALNGGTPNQNVGVARYLGASTLINGHIMGSGSQDPDFNDPDASGPLTGGQISSGLNRGGGEAVDVVEQQGIDGQLLVAVNVGKFGLATFVNLTDIRTGKVYGGYFPPPLLPTLVDFSGKTDQVSAMALQADGKVLMVGRSDIYGANPDMAIARFLPGSQGASIDTTFGTAGKVTVDFFGAFDRAEAVAVQPDGKIVVGGYARNVGTTVFALVRLLP